MPSVSADGIWRDDAVLRLRVLWEEGRSTAEIGRQLGVSKNAVIGKAHRLKLSQRPSPIRIAPAEKARPSRPTRTETPPREAPLLRATRKATQASLPPLASGSDPLAATLPAPVSGRLPGLSFGKTACCWPLGEPGRHDFRFCDAPAVAGKPYCGEHCSLAYPNYRERDNPAA